MWSLRQVEQLWIDGGRLVAVEGGARWLEVCIDEGIQRNRVMSAHVVLNVVFEDFVMTVDADFFKKPITARPRG